MHRIGFLVNPIAGMGGRVGLKGTDGLVEEARRRGAEPRAPERARRALSVLKKSDPSVTILTWGAPMGADIAEASGVCYCVLGSPTSEETSATDTTEAVEAFVREGVDVILFVGGDGTAVDITEQLARLDVETPILGVPAGVKIFSSVFATTPEAAGEIAGTFSETESREVADIDEDAYREGRVSAELKGIVRVPVAEEVQSAKQVRGGDIEGLVEGTIERMDPSVVYFLGPGSTVGEIKRGLGFTGSPLGIDVWQDGSVLVLDATEDELLEYLEADTTIVVSPIGGQGFIFGRGNQQFSPAVIRASDIVIVASRTKLDDIGVLRVDTGDVELDEQLRGWTRVRTGRVEERMMQIV